MNPPAARLPIVALISGRGSNLRVIAGEAGSGRLPVEIRAVVSDREDAPGIAWAHSAGLPCESLSPQHYASRAEYDEALGNLVAGHDPGLVILAGFMRILGPGFVDRYAGRMLNIHPSLLPKYRGLHTHRRALESGDREHGASVHFVTRELDGGPVVLQARVPVRDGDDEASLAARVLEQEHRIYPRTIEWFASGRLALHEGRAWLDGQPLASPLVVDAAHELPA